MKVRAGSQQSIAEGLAQRIAALTAGLADLSEYVRLLARDDQNLPGAANANETSTQPIEFVTENGFAIVRPWETDGAQAPTGRFQFLVRDPHNTECVVTVEIAGALCAATAFDTRGRVACSSSFWICCAERHLADYVTEHDSSPKGYRLLVDSLDCDEVMLALRWGRSD